MGNSNPYKQVQLMSCVSSKKTDYRVKMHTIIHPKHSIKSEKCFRQEFRLTFVVSMFKELLTRPYLDVAHFNNTVATMKWQNSFYLNRSRNR